MKYKKGDKVEFLDYWNRIVKGTIIDIKSSWFSDNKYLIRYTPFLKAESAEWIKEEKIITCK